MTEETSQAAVESRAGVEAAPSGGTGYARAGSEPRRIWPRSRIVRAAAALVAAAVLGGSLWWYFRPAASSVYITAPVSRGAIASHVTASGTVNPVVTVQVGTYVSGVIQDLRCDFNTRVKAGQLCAKIDPRPYQVVVDQDTAALAASRAQLAKDRANLAYAKANSTRQTNLAAQHLVSQDAADLARSAYQQALAQVALDEATIVQRQADLRAAEVNLAYTDITSPVDGTVVTRNVTQGQTVAASFQTPTLFLIATDLTHMEVDASVSESDIGQVRDGDPATFTVEAFPARVFQGRVQQVRQSPQTIQNVVTYDVVVTADNPQLLLKPGMTADVRIVTAQVPDTLRVPVEALRYRPESLANATSGPTPASVWTLKRGKPVAVAVAVGLSDETYTQITRGDLTAGEQVIVGERPAGAGPSSPANRPRAPFL